MSPLGALHGLPKLRDRWTGRVSTWDRTGGNRDFVRLEPGATLVAADLDGPGCLTHLWFTVASADPHWPRSLVLRAYWDGAPTPCILCPFGDFFALGHAQIRPFAALPLSVVTAANGYGGRAGFNCYFPMPFAQHAHLELVNEGSAPLDHLYFNIDYERYPQADPDVGNFHSSWRCAFPTPGYAIGDHAAHDAAANLSGAGNYVVLDAAGRGHYVGTVLSVENVDVVPGMTWWGEGDEMVFVDQAHEEDWPPRLHGTGTEDYFNAAWGFPSGTYAAPYHGLTIAGSVVDWSGQWTAYRFHIADPITFERSIRFTFEHGHANWQANYYSSVAYWYQREPHAALPALPVAEARRPHTAAH